MITLSFMRLSWFTTVFSWQAMNIALVIALYHFGHYILHKRKLSGMAFIADLTIVLSLVTAALALLQALGGYQYY